MPQHLVACIPPPPPNTHTPPRLHLNNMEHDIGHLNVHTHTHIYIYRYTQLESDQARRLIRPGRSSIVLADETGVIRRVGQRAMHGLEQPAEHRFLI